VSRLPSKTDETHYDSLRSAFAAARPDRETIIEIADNGPIYELPAKAVGRKLVVRGAKGFRPLIVWHLPGAATSPSGPFLSVEQGSLRLENLEIVVKCPDTGQPSRASLVNVESGDLAAENCSFSIAGRSGGGVSAIRFSGDNRRCRLNRCYLRGGDMVGMELRSGGDVTVEQCLMVGSGQPVIEIQSMTGATPLTIRVARSTLVGSQGLVRVRPGSAAEREARIRWLSWDTLLARAGSQPGGDLLSLEDGASTAGMQWRSVNCLYVGWQNLLRCGAQEISQADLPVWRKLWQQEEGDQIAVQTWPVALPADPSEVPAAAFRTVGTHAGYASSSGAGALGCDVQSIPSTRDNWLTLTYDRLLSPSLDPAPVDQAPEIPAMSDGRYTGERLDLSRVDLGARLQQLEKAGRLAPTIVLILSGKGPTPTSPIRLKGVNLVLYFQPSQEEKDRLVLIPKDVGESEALIEMDGGGCEIIGGALHDGLGTLVPRYLIKVRGANLRVTGSRLYGRLTGASAASHELVWFSEPSKSYPDQTWECTIADSILQSGGGCLEAVGRGARVRLQNCVIVSATTALQFDPNSATAGTANVRCVLEHNTIAARDSAFRVRDVSDLKAPIAPMIVQADANVFLDPFSRESRSGIVACDDNALAHGLLVWQGVGNGYDKRLHHFIGASDKPVGGPHQPYPVWSRLWSVNGDRRPFFFDGVSGLNLDRPDLAVLALPESARRKRGPQPGADLGHLGIPNLPRGNY
jgi:hypothetical protein